jgi:hypothetical protein
VPLVRADYPVEHPSPSRRSGGRTHRARWPGTENPRRSARKSHPRPQVVRSIGEETPIHQIRAQRFVMPLRVVHRKRRFCTPCRRARRIKRATRLRPTRIPRLHATLRARAVLHKCDGSARRCCGSAPSASHPCGHAPTADDPASRRSRSWRPAVSRHIVLTGKRAWFAFTNRGGPVLMSAAGLVRGLYQSADADVDANAATRTRLRDSMQSRCFLRCLRPCRCASAQASGSRTSRNENLRKSRSWVHTVVTPWPASIDARCASGTRFPRVGTSAVVSR